MGWHVKENMMVLVKQINWRAFLNLCLVAEQLHGCGKACGCSKFVLHCTALCSQCEGQTCKNIAVLSDEDKIK